MAYRRYIPLFVWAWLTAASAVPRATVAQQDEAFQPAQQDMISTIAGGGPNDIPALNANLNLPWEIAVDKQNNYYVAAGGGSSRVFKISPGGVLTVVAGNGLAGYGGDGGPAVDAELRNPHGVAVDDENPANVYIDDWANCLIRKVDQKTGIITTIAGKISKPFQPDCKHSGDGGPAKNAAIDIGWTIAIDPRNNDLYFTQDGYFGGEGNDGTVRKIAGGDPNGIIATVAGNLNQCGGLAPNGVDATSSSAYLCHPQSVTLDTSVSPPNIFVDDWGYQIVYEIVGATGKMYRLAKGFGDPWQLSVQNLGTRTTVTLPDRGRIDQFTVTYSDRVPAVSDFKTIAGNGNAGYCGDGGPVADACFNGVGLALDTQGNWILGDQAADRIRKIFAGTKTIKSIEGWGPAPNKTQNKYSDPIGIKDVPGTGITLNLPTGVYVRPGSSNLVIGADQTEAVYQLDIDTGRISNLAGNGIEGFAGDGLVASSPHVEVNNPDGPAVDSKGNVYSPDANNHVIREISAATGEISTIVGGSDDHLNGAGYSGDGGPATEARINNPHFVAVDPENNLYITEYFNCVVRRVDAKTHIISTFAGIAGHCGYNTSGIAAWGSWLDYPQGVAFDSAGNLYVAEGDDMLRKVDAKTGFISLVAGGVGNGYNGDGPALTRLMNSPQGVAADRNGNLFFADDDNNLLRWVDPGGQMVTFAGSPPGSPRGSNGFAGDGGPALEALLSAPRGITQDAAGNFYFTDRNNDRVRKVTAFAGYGRSTGTVKFFDEKVNTTSAMQPVTLSAIGPVRIGAVTVTAGFAVVNHCLGVNLIAGETCTIDVSFAPTRLGSYTGTLKIESNAFLTNQADTIALAGTATSLPQAATPVFTPATGTYAPGQRVTITDTTAGAKIYYTTDNIAPTIHSQVYSGPITVEKSEFIQAIAVALNHENSEVAIGGFAIRSHE